MKILYEDLSHLYYLFHLSLSPTSYVHFKCGKLLFDTPHCFFLYLTVAHTHYYIEILRLVGGSNKYSGRVEVKKNNIWGSICSTSFDAVDGAVVCKQLGFGFDRIQNFGNGDGQIVMTDVDCAGNETSILKCRHNSNNCSLRQDAGVVCKIGRYHYSTTFKIG